MYLQHNEGPVFLAINPNVSYLSLTYNTMNDCVYHLLNQNPSFKTLIASLNSDVNAILLKMSKRALFVPMPSKVNGFIGS